jgi:CHRD domain
MRKRAAITVGVAALIAAMAIPTLAGGATRLTSNMTGAQVVNPNGGDPDGSAKLKLRVNRVKERLCFTLKATGLSKITGAFIHKGAAGQIARPIITLFNTREPSTVKACEHNVRPRLLKRLKRKPGQHYADVTTKAYPDGAVRGQLG